MNNDLFDQRVQELAQRVGGLTKLADLAELSPSVIRKWRSGSSSPTLTNLAALARAGGASVAWLIGEADFTYPMGTSTVLTTDGRRPPVSAESDKTRSEFFYLPLYDVVAAAGTGKWNDAENVVTHLAFRADWLRKTVGSHVGLCLVSVSGDSMEPTLMNGAVVMIQDLQTPLFADGIYLLRLSGQLVLKRVHRKQVHRVVGQPGEITIDVISDNKFYPAREEVLREGEEQQNDLLGRAVWLGVKLP